MIDYLVNFDISIMSLITLAIILVITRVKRDHFSFSSFLLKILVIITVIGTILEPTTSAIEFVQGRFAYYVGFVSNSLILLNGTLLSAIWISYWDYTFLSSKRRIIQNKYYVLPVIAEFILLVYNRFTGAFFYIEQGTNKFIATPLYPVLYIIYIMYFAYLIILIVKYHKVIEQKVIFASILFMAFPTISIAVQLYVPELVISWPSLTISLLLIYLFLETTTGNIDQLTKLYTRRLLESHLKSLIEDKKPFYALMIDLDRFKEVNDLFGHVTGDQVLIHFADILKKCVHQKDSFVARLGGDEFFIIYQNIAQDQPSKLIADVKDMMTNNQLLKKFSFLDFSCGYISYEDEMSVDDILNLSDREMYKQKNLNRIQYQEKLQK